MVKILEPGGVTTTRFGERSAAEAQRTQAIPDYAAFVADTHEVFAKLRGARLATSEHVAAAIFDAATDGTDRLRYVATPDIEPLVKARRETSEAAYIAGMRDRFLTRR
ncbi:short-chain dehydrogenase [Minicystis rosea]|nr:short-chain dehydrogenase [Minicystis rosea]